MLTLTKALDVCGQAVESEFRRCFIRFIDNITEEDYPGDMGKLIRVTCRQFKDEKKKCGAVNASHKWNLEAPGLRENGEKEIQQDRITLDR